MSWQKMDIAPKTRPILLWGKLRDPGVTALHPHQNIRVVGYWDDIDSAWALTSTPWDGPFFEPICWAEIVNAPSQQEYETLRVRPVPVTDEMIHWAESTFQE
jgi:hypothetical protein